MEVFRTISFRDPESFEDIIATEISNRVILKNKIGGLAEDFTNHEPDTVSLEDFRSDLEDLGEITRFETYMDANSFFETTRGSIKRQGIEHFFHVMYPVGQLYKGYVTGTISSIMYTKEIN